MQSGAQYNAIFAIDDTDANNDNQFRVESLALGTRAGFRIAGASAASVYQPRPTGGLTKTSLAIKANNYNSYVDGLQSTYSTALGSPFTATFMNIGSALSTNAANAQGHWNGHISRIRYWNTRLSDGLLQQFTQP